MKGRALLLTSIADDVNLLNSVYVIDGNSIIGQKSSFNNAKASRHMQTPGKLPGDCTIFWYIAVIKHEIYSIEPKYFE